MRRSTTVSRVVTYAGIDYHKKFSMVALGDQNGRLISTHRLVNDRIAIKQFFSEFPGISCAVESCRGYEWFLDYLKGLGLKVQLANPYRTKLIAQSRCKTDKVDSRILMELLAIGFLPTCYQPTTYERQLRERIRWRAHLVRYATRMKVRIHVLLDKENLGIAAPRLFSAAGRKHLFQVQLTPPRRALLTEHLRMLEQFEEAIAKENSWIKNEVKGNPDARLLLTVPGIGELAALLIVAELGEVNRFKRAGQVAAYAGLVPSVYSSAQVRYLGRLTKQGSNILRWVLVQAAWQAIRHSPDLRFHFAVVQRRNGKNPAIVSVARKLLKIAYRVLRDKKPFNAELVGPRTA